MQMIYNSPNYCVVEFPPQDNHLAMKAGGYEIVDKTMQREIFIDGALAARFREHVQKLMQEEQSLSGEIADQEHLIAVKEGEK